ncbi:pyridoxamine 5'-phosphate oxidase family protein [Candidatus Omnitrophota bacterium]
MMTLPNNIINFFKGQGFVILSTIDQDGVPHSSCKDIIRIEEGGGIYLMDAYRARTFKNLQNNQKANIVAVDEHKFKGYCLKGKAKMVESDKLGPEVLKAWEDKITSRATHRVLKNIRGEKGHALHPETQLPKPQYMIYLQVEEIIDLTPHKLRQNQ